MLAGGSVARRLHEAFRAVVKQGTASTIYKCINSATDSVNTSLYLMGGGEGRLCEVEKLKWAEIPLLCNSFNFIVFLPDGHKTLQWISPACTRQQSYFLFSPFLPSFSRLPFSDT